MTRAPDTVQPLHKRVGLVLRAETTGFDLDTLEAEPGSVFAVTRDFELCYWNPAYERHAIENGGDLTALTALGTNVRGAIHGTVRSYFEERFKRVMSTLTAWRHVYECSSASEYRRFHQSVFPLKDGSAVVAINSLEVRAPMGSRGLEARAPIVERYRNPNGFFTQCSNCRRTQRSDGSSVWDWVPAWVESMPPETSHSICPPCADYYWR